MAKEENCPETSRTRNRRAMKEPFVDEIHRKSTTGKRAIDLGGNKKKDKDK